MCKKQLLIKWFYLNKLYNLKNVYFFFLGNKYKEILRSLKMFAFNLVLKANSKINKEKTQQKEKQKITSKHKQKKIITAKIKKIKNFRNNF